MHHKPRGKSFSWDHVGHRKPSHDLEQLRLEEQAMENASFNSIASNSTGSHHDLQPRESPTRASRPTDLRAMPRSSSPKLNGSVSSLADHCGGSAKHSVHTPEKRHAARLGLPGSPGIAMPDMVQLLEQLLWCLEQRGPQELGSHEAALLDRVLVLAGYEARHRPETALERKLSRHAKQHRKALEGTEAANALLRIALDIYGSVETEDQLAMLLNAHLPSLLAIDECTLFRLDKDQLFDLHASIKREVRGIVGWVACTGKAIRTGSPESEEDLFDAEIDLMNASAYLCIPLALHGAVYGVLRVCRFGQDEPPFTDEEQALLEQAACLLGEALRYMSLTDAMAFEKQKNSFMVELAGSLSSVEIDCDRLVKMVLDYSRTLTNADRCSLFLVDAKQQRLEAYFEGGTVVKMAINQGIAGHVAMTGDVVNIADAYNDERFNRKVDIQTGYHTESLLCLPILYEKEIVAVAQLVNKMEADGQTVTHFTAKDVEIFQAFSGYAAVSLRNARLFRKADLEQLKSVSMLQLAHHLAAEALDEARLAKAVMQHAKAITGADRCSLFVLANDGGDVSLEAYGADDQMVRLPLNSGIAGDVVRGGEAINITDAATDHRFGQGVECYDRYQVKTVLAVPVKCTGTIVAVLQVVNKLDKYGQTVRFANEDEDVLTSFALYAGVSLRTARVFAAALAERAAYVALLDQTVALQRAILAGRPLSTLIPEAAGSLAHAERCVLGIVAPSGRELLLYSAGAYCGAQPLTADTLEGEAVASAQLLSLNNVAADQRARWGGIDSSDKSLLLVPIVLDGKAIGVIKAINRQSDDPLRHAFQKEDLDVLAAFARSVAAALALEREHRAAKVVEAATQALTPLVLDERRLLEAILAQAQRITAAEAASLFVVQGKEFHVVLQGDPEPVGNVRVKVSEKRIEGLAARTRAAVNVPDVVADGRFLSGMEGQHGQRPKCILCVPVLHEGAVVAVLQAVNKVGGVFTAEDEALLGAFAAYAGGCFVASRRHSAVAKSQQQNERAMTVLLKMTTAQPRDVAALMDLLTDGAKTLLACERATAFVADQERHLLYTKSKQKVLGKQLEASLNMGLAAEVVKTGKVINLKDAYLDKRFSRDIDNGHESRTRSVIAMPLQYHDEVVGVIQVINRESGGNFSKHDEFLLATLVHLGNQLVANRRLFDFFIEELSNATMLIQALMGRPLPERAPCSPHSPGNTILSRCLQMVIPEKEISGAKALNFNVLEYKNAAPDSNKSLSLVRLVVDMFVDLGVTAAFHIPLRTLACFVLRVRALSRPNSFHNFLHACDMIHVMYCLLRILGDYGGLDALDRLVLLVAALVHHLDHVGINSSFHFRCDGVMGDTRSTVHPSLSMGLHHCATALHTIMQPDANIFASLDASARTRAVVMLVDLTLFTDRACPGLEAALFPQTPSGGRHNKLCQPSASVPKALLLNALMVTTELSAVLRPFDPAQEWAFYRTEEYYGKGDLAKEWYEEDSVADVSGLATAQVRFLDGVAIPHLILVAQLTPGVLPWLELVQTNRDLWQDLVGCEGEEVLVQPAPPKFRGRRH